jgi:hypothetical protein
MTTPYTPPPGGYVAAQVTEIAAPSPKVTGGVRHAPLGTTLPVNATTALDPAFVTLGRVADDGLDRAEDRAKTEKYDWGGNLIAILQDHYFITVKFKLLQMMNADVQRAVHGTDNVTVTPPTATSGTLISALMNAQLLDTGSWVFDAYYAKMNARLVVPYARIITVTGLKWTHKDLAMFDCTLETLPDDANNHAYEYWDDGVYA